MRLDDADRGSLGTSCDIPSYDISNQLYGNQLVTRWHNITATGTSTIWPADRNRSPAFPRPNPKKNIVVMRIKGRAIKNIVSDLLSVSNTLIPTVLF
jgi:hypothetical protein